MNRKVIAVDIGGTKTTVGLFDCQVNLLRVSTFETRSADGCENLMKRVKAGSEEMMSGLGLNREDFKTAAIVSPGPLDTASGCVVHAPTMNWHHVPLAQIASSQLGVPVIIENDATGAALGEWMYGNGRGVDNLVYMTISTGIGGGIIADGKILCGSHNIAGEIGHACVERGGISCGCGKRGCLEAYASGNSISRIAGAAFGRDISCREVFELSRSGNTAATGIIRQAGHYIGYAVSFLYQILDTELIILGGSVTNDFDVLSPYILETAREYTEESDGRSIKIVKAGLNGLQGLYGAAKLALDYEIS
jgi:glucokinase